MKTVFISRNLSPDSVFSEKLTAAEYAVHGESLLLFEKIPFDHIPQTDWIFFYSQKAVRFFFQNFENVSDFLKSDTFDRLNIAAIGPATGNLLINIFQKCDFIGEGNPEATAEAFLRVAKNQTVLFPRARNSRQSIQNILAGQIHALDLVVYENRPRSDFDLPDFDVLVFTSPMNVKAYFSKKQKLDYQKVVSIGKPTGEALREMGISDFSVADEPSEVGLAEVVLSN